MSKNKKKESIIMSFLTPNVDVDILKGINEPTDFNRAKASIKVIPPRVISEGRGRFASRYAVVTA